MYIFDVDKLEPGDILLTRSNKKPSKLICLATRSDYSHAILYAGGSSYIHSDLDGVHSGNIQRLLVEETHFAKAVRLRTPDHINKAIEYARLQVGTSYSKVGAVNAGIKISQNYSTAKQFCSRLVAKAYAYAGINLVDNSDSCLPKEILLSKHVYAVEDCVRQATVAEINFALSFSPIQKQTDITNHILNQIRSTVSSNIHTFADVSDFLVKNPQHDNNVTEIIENSGYLTMWEHEIKSNPWRYDLSEFLALPFDHDELIDTANKEINVANELLERYKGNCEQFYYFKEIHKLRYAEQQFNLYVQLIKNTLAHRDTMDSALILLESSS